MVNTRTTSRDSDPQDGNSRTTPLNTGKELEIGRSSESTEMSIQESIQESFRELSRDLKESVKDGLKEGLKEIQQAMTESFKGFFEGMQKMQTASGASSSTKPPNGPQENQLQIAPGIGNMQRTEAPAFPAATNGNDGRNAGTERQPPPYVPPPARAPIQFGGHVNNQGQNFRAVHFEQHPFQAENQGPALRNGHNLLNNGQGVDREAVEAIVQEIVGPAFRRVGRPAYRRPYPEAFDRIEFPRGYRMPDFTLFSGEENQSTVEHIGRFTVQCGEAGANEFLKLRLFANSLTGPAFSWYINLQPNSVNTWQDLEQKFHEQFYRIEPEISMADLSRLRQKSGESVEDFIARFKRAKVRCHLNIPEQEFVKMAQGGLSFELRKKFEGTDFNDLFELVSRAARYESMLKEEYQRKNSSRGSYYKDPNTEIYTLETEDQGSEDENAEVDAAEIVATRPYICKALARPTRNPKVPQVAMDMKRNRAESEKTYSFDITKADQIFDIMLEDKIIKLPEGHIIPPAEELKKSHTVNGMTCGHTRQSTVLFSETQFRL